MLTIFDVAKEAGVSKSTVSRVVNGNGFVKEETRKAVEQAIKKLNYTPSYFARGMRTGRTKTIAMLVPEYTNVFYGEMFRGVEDVALKHGYVVLVCNTERHTTSEIEYIEELIKRNVDGIIYNTYVMRKEVTSYLKEISHNIPVVFMDALAKEEKDISYVYTNGYDITRKTVHYLFERGKKRIGYVRNAENFDVTQVRYDGFVKGLEDCGLKLYEELIYQAPLKEEPDYIQNGEVAANYYISLSHRPDAIMTATDLLAIGCVKQFKKEGVKIPEDINIIGYDNISLSRLIEPALTTLGQPTRQLGQTAANIIISKINGQKVKEQVVFEGELIIRESTNK